MCVCFVLDPFHWCFPDINTVPSWPEKSLRTTSKKTSDVSIYRPSK